LGKNINFERHKIIIAIDGVKSDSDVVLNRQVEKVARKFAEINSNVEVRNNSQNFGLGNSVLYNIDNILEKNPSIIVVEDDLVLHTSFLNFCEFGLKAYGDEKCVMSISGFSLPIGVSENTYFLRGADCWGWATWKDRWETFDRNGTSLLNQIKTRRLQRAFDLNFSYQYTNMLERQVLGLSSSWAIRWHASTFLKGGLSLFPKNSLVENHGNDGSGTNMRRTDAYKTFLNSETPMLERISVVENNQARKKLIQFYRRKFPMKLRNKLKNAILSVFYSDEFN
jgi:hypothetical protein